MAGLSGLVLGLSKARIGYNQGVDKRKAREAEQAEQEAKRQQIMVRLALEEQEKKAAQAHRESVLAESIRHNQAVEQASMSRPQSTRIDPLSPEGIKASSILEEARARARAKYRTTGGRGGSSSEEITLPDGTVVQGKPPKTSESERKAAALLGVAESDAPEIDAMETNLPNKVLSKIPILGNMVIGETNPGYQAQRAAAERFVDQWLRLTSGAQVTDSERENARKTFIPEPGDKPETIRQKARAREKVLEGLRRSAGRAAGTPSATPDLQPDDRPSEIPPGMSPTAIARGDYMNDADYWEFLRTQGKSPAQATAMVEQRKRKKK